MSTKTDPRARPKPFTFYPPKTKTWLVGLVKSGIERAIAKKLRVQKIEISDEDLQRLRQLKGRRCLVTPSHSGGFEPHILMYLAKQLDEEFNFVAAMELFEQSAFNRWLMPRLGVYSIIRGAVDRPSFSMTRKLLAEGRRWLVVFPEGQTIWQNSMVIPFQQGVIQLAFKGREDAKEHEADPNLYCVPVAIKYVYAREMYEEIDESLGRIEAKLGIENQEDPAARYARLRKIAETVLVANEKAQKVDADPQRTMNDRIQDLKLHAVRKLEQQLGIEPSGRDDLLDRIRNLFNTVDRIVHEEPEGSEYEQQLITEQQEVARGYYEDLWRLLQFVATYDGYVSESMTFERFLDVLCLLEMELFRERRIWGPRKALVKVGQPIDLRDYEERYRAERRETVQEVTEYLESTVRDMLDALGADCPLVGRSRE